MVTDLDELFSAWIDSVANEKGDIFDVVFAQIFAITSGLFSCLVTGREKPSCSFLWKWL